MFSVMIEKRFSTETAHRLLKHRGKCRNLHGHSYSFDFAVGGEGGPDPSSGMVVDFGDLAPIKNWLDQYWDHAVLLNSADPLVDAFGVKNGSGFETKLFLFPNSDPTAENMAEFLTALWWAFQRNHRLPFTTDLAFVTVFETDTACASSTWQFEPNGLGDEDVQRRENMLAVLDAFANVNNKIGLDIIGG